MTHEVKPLKIPFTHFLLCSIFYGLFFIVATICFYALLNAMALKGYIQVWLHTPIREKLLVLQSGEE